LQGWAVTLQTCWTCLSNSGERRISPAPPVHVGRFWQVEHAYPSALLGWLVIVLRRHTEGLHELEAAEFEELGLLIERSTKGLRRVLSCEKEYVACFAELEGFKHVHFHVVPRAVDLPPAFVGTKSFAFLKVSESEAVSSAAVRAFCGELQAGF